MTNPHSTATIAGHPIHPMLIPFPIALFFAAFVCDLVYWSAGYPAWAQASTWLIGAGIVTAAIAAAVGLIDVLGEKRIRDINHAWWHAGGNAVVVLIQLVNWYIRYAQGEAAIVPWGLALSTIVVGILLFTGWLGWEMVYRHHVGVADEEPPARHRPHPAE